MKKIEPETENLIRDKSEIIEIFQKGNLGDIRDVLYDIHEKRLTIFSREDVEELFTHYDFSKLKQEEFQEITFLLSHLSYLFLADSEIYKKIIKKIIENEVPLEKIINFLIAERNLKILSKEELESLNIKKLTISKYNYDNDLEIDKDIPEEIGYIKSLEELRLYEENKMEQFAILPNSIQNLENLKYLDLRCVMCFPKLITKLKKLKTIILPPRSEHFELPEWIDQLKWVETILFHIWIFDERIEINLKDFFIFNRPEIKLIYEKFNSLPYFLTREKCKEFSFPIDILELYSAKFSLTESKEHQLKIEHLSANLIDLMYKIIYELGNHGYINEYGLIEKTTELIGKGYSHFFKKIIKKTLKTSDKSGIAHIVFFRWLYLLKKKDFIELLKDPELDFHNKLIESQYEYRGFGKEIDDVIFEYIILETIHPSEAQVLRDLKLILSESLLPVSERYAGEEMNNFELKDKHIVSLFIRKSDLDQLPNSIGNLTHLKRLVIENTNLTSLPDTIGNISNLESLNLYGNKLKKLPESIENLKSLKCLDLRSNKLKDIPVFITKLTSLEELYVSKNNIKYFRRWSSIIDEDDFDEMIEEDIHKKVTAFTDLVNAIKNTELFTKKYPVYKTLFENIYSQLLNRNNIICNIPCFEYEFSSLIDSIRDTKLLNDYLPEIIDKLLAIEINSPGFILNVITKAFRILIKSINNTIVFFRLLDSFEETKLIDTYYSEVETLFARILNQLTSGERQSFIQRLSGRKHEHKFLNYLKER